MNYSNYILTRKNDNIKQHIDKIKYNQLLFSGQTFNHTEKNKKIKFLKTFKKKLYNDILFDKIVKMNNKSKKNIQSFKFHKTIHIGNNTKIINNKLFIKKKNYKNIIRKQNVRKQ